MATTLLWHEDLTLGAPRAGSAMMGRNHVAIGASVGLLTLPPAPLPAQIAWVSLLGGCCMLNDLDEADPDHQGAAAHMWGQLTQAISGMISFVARGHRMGTHDLILAPLVFGGLTQWALHSAAGAFVVVAVMAGLAIQGVAMLNLGHAGAVGNLLLSVGAAWWITQQTTIDLAALPQFVVAGVILHALSDLPTDSGIPIPVAWIFGSRARLRLPLLHTGGPGEAAIGVLLWLSLVGLIAWRAGVTIPNVWGPPALTAA